jgi:hypothetical protein
MGAALRDCCRAAVRPLLIAAFLSAAWLVVAAGPASASADKPNPLGGIAQAADSLLQDAHQTGPELPAANTAPASVLGGATEVLASAADSAAPLLTNTVTNTAPTYTVAQTVTDTVVGAVGGVVSVVDSLVPAVQDVGVPAVPVPTIPQVHVHVPELPVHVPDKVIPAHSSGTAVRESAALAAEVLSPASVGRPAGPAEVTAAPAQMQLAFSPVESLAKTRAVREPSATGGYVVSAAPAPENEPDVLRFVGFQTQAGPSSAGAGSAGAEASGDVDGFWNLLHHAGRQPVPDAALVRAASPAFDPGSSPD